MTDRLYPAEWDRDTGPFFAAAREGRLVYCACESCGRGQHVPAPSCRFCGNPGTVWRDAPGEGRLYSWTTVTHQAHPAWPVPYTVVIVTLDAAPDVRLTGCIEGAPDLVAGQPMRLWFQDIGQGRRLPNWRSAETNGDTA